jgi:hypothetical protein
MWLPDMLWPTEALINMPKGLRILWLRLVLIFSGEEADFLTVGHFLSLATWSFRHLRGWIWTSAEASTPTPPHRGHSHFSERKEPIGLPRSPGGQASVLLLDAHRRGAPRGNPR